MTSHTSSEVYSSQHCCMGRFTNMKPKLIINLTRVQCVHGNLWYNCMWITWFSECQSTWLDVVVPSNTQLSLQLSYRWLRSNVHSALFTELSPRIIDSKVLYTLSLPLALTGNGVLNVREVECAEHIVFSNYLGGHCLQLQVRLKSITFTCRWKNNWNQCFHACVLLAAALIINYNPRELLFM